MSKAHTNQILFASSTVYRYGKDQSGTIEYKFNSNGFRSSLEYNELALPNIIFAGGSTSFGVGVSEQHCYKSLVAKELQVNFWDISYAYSYYNNYIIYKTITEYSSVSSDMLIVQWVSDSRNILNPGSLDEYVDHCNQLFKKTVHFISDSLESRKPDSTIKLINPIFIDQDAGGFHPGPRTHARIAKYILKELRNV